MDSIGYYNKNSQEFYDRTIKADLNEIYQKFLKYVGGGRILDAGCGVGRDSKFFLSRGFEVVPVDGSVEMVRMATEVLGQPAVHMLFEEIDFANEFQAVWASASLLHVPSENLREILQGFHQALFPHGFMYASFKYGTGMRQVGDRFFFDMNEENLVPYLEGLFVPLEIWKSEDRRSVAPSPDKSWLHCIAKRV